MTTLRVYPAIGVARVGNSDQFYVGPEQPGIPANWDPATSRFRLFKDAQGKVLRQAARFRVYAVEDNGEARELTLSDVAKIEWRVHVANRKASFFSFNGQSGNETDPPYEARAKRPANSVEKPARGRGEPEIHNLRNSAIADRRSLEIDPGEVAIAAPGQVELVDAATSSPVKKLGDVQMEDSGRLVFLGGIGRTEGTNGARPIEEYANNDGWFDDMCDGHVRAIVTFRDGHTEEAEPAWVIVGPPDYAPGIGNVVSLYDTLWDIAVRERLPCEPSNDVDIQDLLAQQRFWQDATADFSAGYEPSFLKHIYPILSRALAARDVHLPPNNRKDWHGTLPDWTRLSQRSEDQIRDDVFRRIRDPNSKVVDRINMPRGLGDDYSTLDASESDPSVQPSERAFLSLTKVQFALLKAWADGRFKEDWTFGDAAYAPIPAPSSSTPHGLTAAALENCVGGPFFPGIEVSWLVRRPALYRAAFRFKASGFALGSMALGAGFFSQQMALPWQADFYDCHKEDHTPAGSPEPLVYMWWTAQRPDNIRAAPGGAQRRWVEPFDAAKEPGAPDPDDTTNLARFEQMRTRWWELSFVVLDGDDHIEQK